MELIPLSRLRSHALRDLFQEELEAWASTLRWDYSGPLQIIADMMDSVALPGYVVLKEGLPAGYVFYLEEGNLGIIGNCFVSRKFAGQGIEEGLLSAAVESLKINPRITRIEAQFINFGEWPLQTILGERGFQTFERHFMLRNCGGIQVRAAPEGIEFGLWEEKNLDTAAELTAYAYEKVVDREISFHYRSVQGCSNFLRNIISKPGCGTFIRDASFCAWHRESKQLIGFVLTSHVSSQNAHIPQVLISPRFQGRGVGSQLLSQAIFTLSAFAYQTVSLSVTANNTPALSLYQRLDFKTVMRFPASVWSR